MKHEEYSNNPVVYLITIGEKYYIGKADKYKRRVGQHICNIKNLVWNPDINNIPENSSYFLIRKYLLENPHIEDIFFEVIELCSDPRNAEQSEFGWFMDVRVFGLHDLFLNYDQVHKDRHDLSGMDMKGMGLFCL